MNPSALARRIMLAHKAELEGRKPGAPLRLADLLVEAVEAGYAAAQADREIASAVTVAGLITAHAKGRRPAKP